MIFAAINAFSPLRSSGRGVGREKSDMMAQAEAVCLAVDGLVVDRGERRVIDGLALRVASGEALIVTGRNGAGKSTLLRAVAGLTAIAAGTITLTCTGAAFVATTSGAELWLPKLR